MNRSDQVLDAPRRLEFFRSRGEVPAMPAMTNSDWRQWVDFAIRWEPFGGGDEDILPQFGVSPETFYRRLQKTLSGTPPDITVIQSITVIQRYKLERLCEYKLHRQPLRAVAHQHPTCR